MKFSSASLFLSGFYATLVLLWFTVSSLGLIASPHLDTFLTGVKDAPYSYFFAFAYGLIPIIGGVLGFNSAQKWGLFKSSMGIALFFLSMGLITWGYGELIWSYYNFFLNQEIPYPSWADASFILSWPLWSIGVLYLGKATGIKFGLRNKGGQLLLILVPLFAMLVSYYLLVVVARGGSLQLEGGMLKIFFDLAYPLLDVVILTLAVIVYGLSFKYLGGQFKWPVLITLFGFVVNYMADFAFSYTTTVGTFSNGNWVDLLFATSVFILSFGITSFELKES